MMHDLSRRGARRLGLNSSDVAIFRQPEISKQIAEDVWAGGRDLIHWELHNQIRLTNLPRIGRSEHRWRRGVSWITLRRAAIYPLDDRRDLVVGQRRIVEETLNTNVAV